MSTAILRAQPLRKASVLETRSHFRKSGQVAPLLRGNAASDGLTIFDASTVEFGQLD